MTILTFSSPKEVETQIQRVVEACEQSVKKVVDLALSKEPLGWFYDVKFKEIGLDGLFHRPQNLVEQINQTFTYLVTFQGIKYLLSHHPESGPYKANPGARKNPDIISQDGMVMAEAFAAVHPTNNRKLLNDLERCSQHQARYKYVFFHSPSIKAGPYVHKYGFLGIKVLSIGLPEIESILQEYSELDEKEWLKAAMHNPVFGFLKEREEDIYTPADGKPFHDAR